MHNIEGVADVSVDVTAGRVTATSSQLLSPAVIREAVEEAGYELVNGSA